MTPEEVWRLHLDAGTPGGDAPAAGVVAARAGTRRAAEALGCGSLEAARIACAVAEVVRVAGHHGPVHLTLAVTRPPADASGGSRVLAAQLHATVACEAGCAPEALADGEPAPALAARLLDHVGPVPGGLVMSRSLPAGASLDDLAGLRRRLGEQLPLLDGGGSGTAPDDVAPLAVDEVGRQDAELVHALLALDDRGEELERLGDELEQTNRGVVALYAELEQRAEEVRRAQRAVFEELEGALRPPPPTVDGVQMDVRYLPAQRNSPTGGDLYDWLELPDGSLHVAVVDALGHGVASTRDALLVTHAVRTLTLEGHGLDRVVQRTDTVLHGPGDEVVATVLLARLDPRSGELRLAAGGHPPALVVPVQGPPRYLSASGRPVGYPAAGSDGTAQAQLSPGDTVLLYTDGLVEVRRDMIEGLETLAVVADRARDLELGAFLDAVLAGCAQDDPLRDDTLLLALRWSPPTRGA